MRAPAWLGLFLAAAATGCGSGGSEGGGPTVPAAQRQAGPAPARIVRAWSRALNAGDNERAADLFAGGALVIQGGATIVLRTHADAVAWNASLPCSGRIVAISTIGTEATATFLLGDRKTSRCDGPGHRAAAVFRIRRGKIVLWHQIPVPQAPSPPI